MGEGDSKGDNYELVKNLVDIGPVDLEKIISKKCEKQREKPDKKNWASSSVELTAFCLSITKLSINIFIITQVCIAQF